MARFSHGAMFGLVLFALFSGYLLIVNDVAAKGSDIRTLEKRIAMLEKSIEEQTIHEARLRALVDPNDNDDFEAISREDVRIITAVAEHAYAESDAHGTVIAIANQ